MCLKKNHTTYPNFDNHSKPNNNQLELPKRVWSFIEHKNLHFDNAQDIYVSSKDYEESKHGFDLNLLTI